MRQRKCICLGDCIQSPVIHAETVGPIFLSNHNNGTGQWGVRWLDNSILLQCLQQFGHFLAKSERHSSWGLFLGACFSCVYLHADKVCFSMLTLHQTKHSVMVRQELLKQFRIRQGQSGRSIVSSSFSFLQESVPEMVIFTVTVSTSLGCFLPVWEITIPLFPLLPPDMHPLEHTA